ncbi:uncharacterized protein DS421_20g695220 [Arachis hypogaea]|nr:uncharacterized protein DS421_20g695220 [Arachis hypogaea]
MQLGWMNDKKIYPEVPFQLPKDGCSEIKAKIKKRKWEELTSLITRINANIIREFYANTARLDMTEAPTYKSYVRGVEVDFSLKTIMKVLGLRPANFDEPGYQERVNEKPDYDEISSDIYVFNADWERENQGGHKFLKREDLNPKAKGWYELIKRSILNTVNTSEVNKKRAIMLHCIMLGGEIKVHEIIANDIQKVVEKNSVEAWLHYPSTIMRLFMNARVPIEDANPTWLHPGMPMTLERMMNVIEAQKSRRPQRR